MKSIVELTYRLAFEKEAETGLFPRRRIAVESYWFKRFITIDGPVMGDHIRTPDGVFHVSHIRTETVVNLAGEGSYSLHASGSKDWTNESTYRSECKCLLARGWELCSLTPSSRRRLKRPSWMEEDDES